MTHPTRASMSFLCSLGMLGVPGTTASQTVARILSPRLGHVARVAEPMAASALEVHLLDGNSARVGNRRALVSAPGGGLTLSNPTSSSDASGVVRFEQLTISGPPGNHTLVVTADTASLSVSIELKTGAPSRLKILTEPPSRTLSDSTLKPAIRVRVLDAAGNPVSRQGVAVKFKWDQRTADRLGTVQQQATEDQVLTGTTVVQTDGDGIAAFSDLVISGKAGLYTLEFGSGSATEKSKPIRYYPDEVHDRSYVIVSGIKSIAGVKPADEFFDLRFRFRVAGAMSALAGIDLALTNRDTDSVGSPQKALTEAYFQVNLFEFNRRRNPRTDVPERVVGLGPQIRIFNSVPYLGVYAGSVELGGSAFQGSQISLGLLHRFNEKTIVAEGDTVRAEKVNAFADFFIHSGSIAFFKKLNVRGGVLLPLRKGIHSLTSRITIAIPVESIDW